MTKNQKGGGTQHEERLLQGWDVGVGRQTVGVTAGSCPVPWGYGPPRRSGGNTGLRLEYLI